jgi:hypothetical protein
MTRNTKIFGTLIALLSIGLANASFPRISVGLSRRNVGRSPSDHECQNRSVSLETRGGSAAPVPAKTMTASQMNTLK